MRFHSNTVAIVLILCNNTNNGVNAFTSPSFMKSTTLINKNSLASPPQFDKYQHYNAVVEKESVTNINIDDDDDGGGGSNNSASIEEKAWKIVDDKTKDINFDVENLLGDDSNNNDIQKERIAMKKKTDDDVNLLLDEIDLVSAIEDEASLLVDGMFDEECEITETGEAVDEYCSDESKLTMLKSKLKKVVTRTLGFVRTGGDDEGDFLDESSIDFDGTVPEGELLEQGWEKRGNSSAIRRNAEVWKFALKCVFKALKPRKLKKKGASDDEIKEAQIEAATFIRNGLLRLGPSFVKLGQVVSTRTDVLPTTYTDVLKTLQDDVPGFSGKRAKDIVSKELGRPCDEVFQNFSEKPLAAASLGQVHTATYKGKKVAIKVQRAGLKELFDVDLKNLKKLAALLDKFDPKTDGAGK